MIRISESEYAAIGRVAVESGTLDRELGEYLVRLAVPKYKPTMPVSDRVRLLSRYLAGGSIPQAAHGEFDFALTRILALLERRNALAHGTWSESSKTPSTLIEVRAVGKKATVNAMEIEVVAQQLRIARKLLFRLFLDYLPLAAGHKKCPKKSAAELRTGL